jgi:hypothetical protein
MGAQGGGDHPRDAGKMHGEIGDPEAGRKPEGTRPPLPEVDPALNDPDATPGTGMLPLIGEENEANIQPSS